MKHTLAFGLVALATPAIAENWTCTLATFCDTNGSCETPEKAMGATFEISGDSTMGFFVIAEGTDEEKRLTLRSIAKSDQSRTFVTEVEKGELAFISIFADGKLLASSHEVHDGDVWASALEGTCARSDG